MPRTISLLAATLALAMISAPVAAQAVDQDVRCWMASQVFVKAEKDPAKRQVAGVVSIFYFGRVDARMNAMQLKNAVDAQSKLIKPADLGPIMNACAKRLNDKQMALRAVAGPPPAAPAKK